MASTSKNNEKSSKTSNIEKSCVFDRYINYNTMFIFKDSNEIINKIINDMNTIDDETLSVRIVYLILILIFLTCSRRHGF